MVDVIVRNPAASDKIITVSRDPVTYTVPAGGEVTVTLDNPSKDRIELPS